MELLFSGTSKEQNTKSKFMQGTYDFLDNSNWEIAHVVRRILQDWANDFKPDKDFLSSFKTEEHFHSHFFELFVWKYFTELGNSVEKTDRNCNTTVPDFLCINNQKQFYIECTAVEFRQEQIKNQILDSIENMDLPNVGLCINFISSSSTTPSLKRIIKDIQYYLSQSFDSFSFDENDWRIEFRTYPKNENITTNVFSVAGGNNKNQGFINLKKSLQKKARMKYDIKSNPFVLAVNTNDVFLEEDDYLKILFGKLEDGQSKLYSTSEDSLFLSKHDSPKNSHISAVLICNNLTPWNIDGCKISLWHNPNATVPYLPPDNFCDSVTIKQELIKTKNTGIHPSTFLNLPHDYYLKSKFPKQYLSLTEIENNQYTTKAKKS